MTVYIVSIVGIVGTCVCLTCLCKTCCCDDLCDDLCDDCCNDDNKGVEKEEELKLIKDLSNDGSIDSFSNAEEIKKTKNVYFNNSFKAKEASSKYKTESHYNSLNS